MTKRPIKFRAWLGDKMIDPWQLDFLEPGHIEIKTWEDDEECPTNWGCTGTNCLLGVGNKLMQFTGLLDKNGVEIYEGDFVKTYGEGVGVIKWADDAIFSVGFIAEEILPAQPVIDTSDMKTFKQEMARSEVIGNVFQNGDLLPQAVIPDKASAISFSGGKNDSVRLVLDLYSEDPAELLKLVQLRGERLFVTFIKEDDVHKGEPL